MSYTERQIWSLLFNTYYSGVWVQLSKKTHYFAYLALIHRRRIELEDKAKVIALDWGTESLPR